MLIVRTPHLGEIMKLKPEVLCDKTGHATVKAIPGKVVYINEKHRFFTAEFIFPATNGRFRESFKFYNEWDFAKKEEPIGYKGAYFDDSRRYKSTHYAF